MSTTPQHARRDLALTIITAVIGLSATMFAIASAAYLLSL